MHSRSFIVLALLAIGTLNARAQGGSVNPACADAAIVGPGLIGGSACQRAFDSFAYTTQQYAVLLSAGNIEMGRADALGGFPHFRVALHATAMSLAFPAFVSDGIPVGPASATTLSTQSTDFATVAVDGTLGLFKGFDLVFARVGALDLYVSANIVPGTSASGYSVNPSNKLYFAWGGRVGLLQEGKMIPGVGVSYLSRKLPKTTVTASEYFGNTLGVTDLVIDTHAWSVTVGKHFGVVGLLLGGGQTTFSSSGNLTWLVPGNSPSNLPTVTATSAQTQYFGDFSLTFGPVGVVFEIGQVQGSTLTTYNSFDPGVGATRSYASGAVTFGL